MTVYGIHIGLWGYLFIQNVDKNKISKYLLKKKFDLDPILFLAYCNMSPIIILISLLINRIGICINYFLFFTRLLCTFNVDEPTIVKEQNEFF